LVLARQNYKAEKRRREVEKKKKKEAKREKRLHRVDENDDGPAIGEEKVGNDVNADAAGENGSDPSSQSNTE
jgi:hypothetical protein